MPKLGLLDHLHLKSANIHLVVFQGFASAYYNVRTQKFSHLIRLIKERNVNRFRS